MRYLMILALIAFSTACQNSNETVPVQDEEMPVVLTNYQHFGEAEVSPESAMPVSDAVAKAETHKDHAVTLEGEVAEVCQMKGCWMTLVTGEDETIRVTFKDYGFFVPKDISGRNVVLSGVLQQDTLTVDVLKHYAEEAGKSQEEIDAITEPSVEWAILADGVLVENAD